MASASVNMHGQITLPVEIRRNLGIAPGSVLNIEQEDNGIMLKKAVLVEVEVLEKIRNLAKAEKWTRKKMVETCRKIGREVYKSEYPEDV